MSPDHRDSVTAILITDVLEASQGKNGPAAMLLVDAALSILLSSLDRDGAREMADMLGDYCRDQVAFVLAKGGAA